MKYQHILSYVMGTPWAILPSKMDAILSLLDARSAGIVATDEELAAFAGGRAEQSQRGAIAIVPLRGIIAHRAGTLEASSGGVSTEAFAKSWRQVMEDPSISAVVIDTDSPGGAVPGVHELAQAMLATRGRKPVAAVANSTMASAAYWLAAAAADRIFAIPSATLGSIGVAAARTKKVNEDVEVFTSGDNKADSLGVGPVSEDGRKRLQAMVNQAGGWFRADVAKGRGVSVAAVRERFGEGAIFTATDALSAGLIDEIGSMDDALRYVTGAKATVSMRAETFITLAETDQHSGVLAATKAEEAEIAALVAKSKEFHEQNADRVFESDLLWKIDRF